MSFPTIANFEPFEYAGHTFRADYFNDLDGDDVVKELEIFVGKYELNVNGLLDEDTNEALWNALHDSDDPFDLQHWVSLIITSFIEHPTRDKHIVNEQHWGWTGE